MKKSGYKGILMYSAMLGIQYPGVRYSLSHESLLLVQPGSLEL